MPLTDKQIIAELLDRAGISRSSTGGNGIETGGAVFRFNGADALIEVDGEAAEPEYDDSECEECSELEEKLGKAQALAEQIAEL